MIVLNSYAMLHYESVSGLIISDITATSAARLSGLISEKSRMFDTLVFICSAGVRLI